MEDSSSYFYRGKITLQEGKKKLSFPVEVYMDPHQSQFRVDALGGFSGVLLSFTWNQETGIKILIPHEKKYMNSLRSQKASTQQVFSWVVSHLPHLYTSLHNRVPEGWDCQFREILQRNQDSSQKQTLQLPRKCKKDKLTILWKYRFFKPRSFHLLLREKKINMTVDLNRTYLSYLSSDIFNIQIPKSFKKMDYFDIDFFK